MPTPYKLLALDGMTVDARLGSLSSDSGVCMVDPSTWSPSSGFFSPPSQPGSCERVLKAKHCTSKRSSSTPSTAAQADLFTMTDQLFFRWECPCCEDSADSLSSFLWHRVKRALAQSRWLSKVECALSGDLAAESFFHVCQHHFLSTQYQMDILEVEHFVSALKYRMGQLWNYRLTGPAAVFFESAKAVTALCANGKGVAREADEANSNVSEASHSTIWDLVAQAEAVVVVASAAVDRWICEEPKQELAQKQQEEHENGVTGGGSNSIQITPSHRAKQREGRRQRRKESKLRKDHKEQNKLIQTDSFERNGMVFEMEMEVNSLSSDDDLEFDNTLRLPSYSTRRSSAVAGLPSLALCNYPASQRTAHNLMPRQRNVLHALPCRSGVAETLRLQQDVSTLHQHLVIQSTPQIDAR